MVFETDESVLFIEMSSINKIIKSFFFQGKSTLVPLLVTSALTSLLPLWPYVVVGVTFAIFLAWNGSVVVGDRTHHQLHINFPQILYFVSFSAFFSSPYLLVNFRLWQKFLSDLKKFKWMVGLMIIFIFAVVSIHFFT